MRRLHCYGEPSLRKAASPIECFDERIEALAHEMIEVMRASDGIGLAAPQVGETVKLMVVDTSHGESPPYILANPEIIYASEEKAKDDEGCLSLPGITIAVNRAAVISVRGQNEKGETYTIENADGLLARALQHEIDHLNGILTIDHVSSVQRALLGGKLKKISKERGN